MKAAFPPWISQTKPFPPTLQTCQLLFYLLSRRSPCGGDHSSILPLAGSARQFRETTASLRIRCVLEVHGWGPPLHWLERSLKTAILVNARASPGSRPVLFSFPWGSLSQNSSTWRDLFSFLFFFLNTCVLFYRALFSHYRQWQSP